LASLMIVSATDDLETSSLLQSKRDSITRVDTVSPVLDRAAVELRSLTAESDVEHVMASFAAELKSTANSMIQLPSNEKDALLQRASQTKELTNFVESYVQLSEDIKKKVDDAALNTPIMNQVYDSLGQADSHALLMQLDRATTGKRCYYTTRNGERVRECTSSSSNGRGGHSHRHWHGDRGSGTETITRNKDGELVHRHFHEYRHDGSGGNAQTDTVTQGKDSYRHDHGHRHRIDGNGRTFTNTNSGTTFHGGENTHSHSHEHNHAIGESTNTQTNTVSTDSGGRFHGHGHTHSHDEQTGNHRSTSTHCDGPNPGDCDTLVTD